MLFNLQFSFSLHSPTFAAKCLYDPCLFALSLFSNCSPRYACTHPHLNIWDYYSRLSCQSVMHASIVKYVHLFSECAHTTCFDLALIVFCAFCDLTTTLGVALTPYRFETPIATLGHKPWIPTGLQRKPLFHDQNPFSRPLSVLNALLRDWCVVLA